MRILHLFEFDVTEISTILKDKFKGKATTFWDGKMEFKCFCDTKDIYVYVMAATRDEAIKVLQSENGACSKCTASNISDGWVIIGDDE